MSQRNFATDRAMILYAVPLNMVEAITFEAVNCMSKGWSRGRWESCKSCSPVQCGNLWFGIDFNWLKKLSAEFVDSNGRNEIVKIRQMFVVSGLGLCG